MIDQALEHLRSGGVIAYPTETFYGLGVDIFNSSALDRLKALKGREALKPFPVLLDDVKTLSRIGVEPPPQAEIFIRHFWPGPLTIVMHAPNLPLALANEGQGVGFRISEHPIATQLVSRFGSPITTTSANLSGAPPARSETEIRACFSQNEVFLVPGGELSPDTLPSTVIEFVSQEKWVIHREGAISSHTLHALL